MNISFNTAIGAWLFVAGLLMVVIFGLMPVSDYWLVLWTVVGGAGLLLIVFDNLERK